MKKETLIPPAGEGKNINLQEEKMLADKSAAEQLFELASKRLLNPREWKDLTGVGTASFKVIGPDKQEADRGLQKGDFVRIDIPGPGGSSGDGYDWVRVDMIEISDRSEDRFAGIKLVPCDNPLNDEPDAAHFFDENSSSTMIVTLNEKTVTASYHGRNETVNNETESVVDNIRNTVIAAGALLGFSEIQWKKLIRGFLS